MKSELLLQTYGADLTGMVCGFRFTPTLAGQPLEADEVIAWCREHKADAGVKEGSDEFLWLHFNLAHSASERWMRSQLDLPETFFDTLREGSHSTRIEHADGALRAVVNDVIFNLEFIPSEIATLWIYVHKRIIVTARLKPLRSIDRLRASVRDGEIFRSAVELLVHLMRDQADLLVQIVRRTSAEVDRIEDRFLSQRPTQNRLDLGAMRRTLTRLQRMLAPEPGAIFRLLARPPRWLHPEDVQDLRESTEEFSVVLSDVAGLIERVRLLQEEITSRLDAQNNRTLFTLTLVTVLAMPINIVAGFFGMNVGGVPLAENKNGFWVMVLLVAGFTGLAGWWVFRRRRER